MGSLLQLDSDVSRGERRQERLQDLVPELSTEFINLSADEIDRAITEALRRVAEFVVIDRAYVFLIDQDAMRMSNTHEWCRDGVASMIQNLQDVPVGAYAWSMSRILKGDILYIPRVAEIPDEQPDKDLLQAEGIQSLLAVPITSRERAIGLIGLDAVFAEHRWREGTIALLKMVGAVFGNAIELR